MKRALCAPYLLGTFLVWGDSTASRLCRLIPDARMLIVTPLHALFGDFAVCSLAGFAAYLSIVAG